MRLPVTLQPLSADDFPKLMKLWKAAEAVVIREADDEATFRRFLQRNPETNFAAYAGTRMVGSVLAGQDGWRGYLYHMAVKPDYREKGIASQLVNVAVDKLRQQGISKVHCLVKKDNLVGQQFWEACSFQLRDELLDYSI